MSVDGSYSSAVIIMQVTVKVKVSYFLEDLFLCTKRTLRI